jgi:XTP/dITP diphosphohydrolase
MKEGLTTIVVATNNHGKLGELRELLSSLPIEIRGLSEVLDPPPRLIEDGETFEANAVSKAQQACRATGCVTLADDSGLEVDALGGRPGVRSARFAHDRATDADNIRALLEALEAFPEGQRQARFRCVLALVTPWDPQRPRLATGCCEGSIALSARGSGGFGYDPLFVAEGQGGYVMAELPAAEKNAISHRGRAVRALKPLVEEMLQARPQ